METPICDFVKDYAASRSLRLHMPGHKGTSFLGLEALDITEIDGADVLYQADGIIRRSEKNAAGLFDAAKTVYSTEGSSLSIRAMLYLTAVYAKAKGKRPLIAAGRNAHKVFMTTAALLDVDVAWLFPEKQEGILSCRITADALDNALSGMKDKPVAVYITSPDYLGNVSDLGRLSQVCHRHDALFLVDNAHGAYLQFLPDSRHPMALGADMCCDSAHKTLPVLTGGAYLHISHGAPKWLCEQVENAMALFASTSPSYLILQSLDAANRYLAEGYPVRLAEFEVQVSALKERLVHKGYTLIGQEPLKLTIAPKSFGYTGRALAQILLEQEVVCEFSDPDFVVMMLTPETGKGGLDRLERALTAVERRDSIPEQPPAVSRSEPILSMREALFLPDQEREIHRCCGSVLSTATVGCPPAIPIVVCGERIDEAAIRCFEYYGITTCRVVDDRFV